MARIWSRTYHAHSDPENASTTAQRSKLTSTSIHVILTGSTGNVGAYVLHSLLSQSQIKRVTCLNRSSDAATRQLSSHERRGLDQSADILRSNDPRVSFLTVDLADPRLGLSDSNYARLANTATHILHNAWPVSFNLSFSSFRPSLIGVNNLIFLALACKNQCTLTFISSVSVVGRWGTLPGSTATVPEVVLRDWRTAKMGYGQSKLVAENLFIRAAEEHNLKTTIIRVGQVAGPVERGLKGQWSETEWFPSLIRSSAFLRVLPGTLGPMDNIDWIPVDILGEVIAELILHDSASETPDNERITSQTTAEDTTDITSEKKPAQQNTKKAQVQSLFTHKHFRTPRHRPNTAGDGLVTIYHVSNPGTTTYFSTLLPVILKHLNTNINPGIVPSNNAHSSPTTQPSAASGTTEPITTIAFQTWVTALETSLHKTFQPTTNSSANGSTNTSTSTSRNGDEAEQNPATKLLPFFKDLQDKSMRFPDARTAMLETRETRRISGVLRACEDAGVHGKSKKGKGKGRGMSEGEGKGIQEEQGKWEEWMEIWLRQWGF